MNLKHLLVGAIATLVGAILPTIPTPNPTLDVIKGAVVGTSSIVSQVAHPAATPIIVAQVVKAQWEGQSTPLGTTTSLALIAGGAIVLKTTKKVMGSQLSNKASVRLLQEIGINTISMSLPLAAGSIAACLIGWQNIARVHNTIIMPMLVPGIAVLVLSKVVGHGQWKETIAATIGSGLAIVASNYHPLGVGIVLSSIYSIPKEKTYHKPTPDRSLYSESLHTIQVPQWVYTCIYLGTTLIGVPVSQLYSVMQYGYPTPSEKVKAILEGVMEGIETLTSVVFYLLWGMAREGSFTDPMSKALQNVPMEWYIPLVGLILVIGTVWYLYYYMEVTIPLYTNYRVEGAACTISGIGMLFLGTYLLVIPFWIPTIGLCLGYACNKLNISLSMLGSIMPIVGIVNQ